MNPEAAELLRCVKFSVTRCDSGVDGSHIVRGGAKRQTGGWRYWVQRWCGEKGVGSKKDDERGLDQAVEVCEGIRY